YAFASIFRSFAACKPGRGARVGVSGVAIPPHWRDGAPGCSAPAKAPLDSRRLQVILNKCPNHLHDRLMERKPEGAGVQRFERRRPAPDNGRDGPILLA